MEKMDKNWKQFRTLAIIISGALLILGLVMVIWPGISAIAVCYIAGALCVVMGVVALVRYFKLGGAGLFFRFDFALGVCGILIGCLLFVHPSGAMAFLPVAIGIYMIIESVIDIQLAVELKRGGDRGWWMEMLSGIIGAVFALLLLIDPFSGTSLLMIFAGISLMIIGIQGLHMIIAVSKAVKSENQDVIWSK